MTVKELSEELQVEIEIAVGVEDDSAREATEHDLDAAIDAVVDQGESIRSRIGRK